jgi:hypothetical protein
MEVCNCLLPTQWFFLSSEQLSSIFSDTLYLLQLKVSLDVWFVGYTLYKVKEADAGKHIMHSAASFKW